MVRKLITFLVLIVTINSVTHSQDNVLWKFKTQNRVYSTPLINGNMIYFGSGDHNFYSLNKKTGVEVWKYETEGAVHSSPFVFDEIVYFASGDGFLYALNKFDGKLIWKFESKGEKMHDIWDYYLSSPVVDEELIYWGCGDGNIYALYANSGELKWKFQTENIVHASPVIDQNHLYIGGFDGYFYCIRKDNGKLEWKFRTVGTARFPNGGIQTAALVKDDVVYFGSRDYNIYALDAKTGRGKWNFKQPRGWITPTPIEYKGNIYFGTSDTHVFYNMNKDNGTVNWVIPVRMRVYGRAIAYNDMIYFGVFDGRVLGVDYLNGELKWVFQTEMSKMNYHKMYDDNGEFKEGFELYALGAEGSEKLIHSLGSVLSSPVIEEDIIYFGSSDGFVYAIEL